MINFYTFEMAGTTKTKRGPLDRRDFLKMSMIGASGAALSPLIQACAQMDRMIVGDGSDETQSVLILGAGLSGLTAARELKKMGIPFRVFEGSQRIGGRALTVEEFNVASQSVEMGAEWISTNDDFVLNLCRELKIRTGMLNPDSRALHLLQGESLIDFQNLLKDLKLSDRKILDKKEKLSDFQWDTISAEELLTDLRSTVDERTLLWMRRMIQLEWGCEAFEMSSLALLDRFGSSPTGWKRFLEKRVRIPGGIQNLSQALYDKISGVVPGRFVLFDHQLAAISSSGDKLKLEFDTKDGRFSIGARVVICTLPFSVLRQIKGIDELDFSPNKMKAIQELGYGSHGKMALSYKEKFWQSKSPVWTGDLRSQWIWEAGIDSNSNTYGYRGILTAQMGGKQGQSLGTQNLEEFKSDIRKLNMSAPVEESSQFMNWSMNRMSQGSVSVLRPGQVHTLYSTLITPERRGTFIFAGEHTSLSSMGTLNGAVESGIRAAIEASHFKKELNQKLIF